ncbi:hypothetical protein ZWY2020_008355 [Hordeum vulgare]|nr:hypothetical protein ZWY2020_008355 [Hordeum vulgare]
MAVESAITVVLSKLAAHEAEELRRIGDGIVLLRDRLQWLQAFLCDADRKRRAGIPVDGLSLVCLRPMRDITFDAEDTLNDLIFHHQAALRSHGYQSQKTPMRYFVGLFSRMENRRELSSQIKRIKAAFDQILDDQKYCRVEHISSMAQRVPPWPLQRGMWGDLENVVGFDKDMEILKQILVHKDEDSHHKMFISIVGESGAGKNTLVQLICDQDTWQDANEIVHMWVAEGFINKTPSQHGKTLEEVGHDYLKELVLRCLLRLEERKLGGGIMVVRVHRSLMRFLRFEISETGFMDIIHNVKYNVLMRPSVRRISVQSDCTPMYTTNQKFPKLHSFICHVEEKKHEEIEAQRMWTNKKSVHNDIKFLCWSKFLHVLSLKGLTLNALPDELGDMIHLRYLCVNCPNLHILPSSIVRLLNLQTLDIRNTQVEEIHRDFWKIKTLRHVLAKTLALPTMSMPLGVEEQEEDDEVGSELQTLHGVKPASSDLGEWTLLDNKITRNLRSFEMHGFQYAKHGGPMFKAALQNMYLLGHLNLQGDEIPSCVFTDPGLQSLETMEIHGNVRWDDIIPVVHLLRKVRPNLVQLKVRDINEENMDLPDLNYTPPAEDGDEMDADAGNEMVGDIGDDMEGDGIVEYTVVEQVAKRNKTLNDQQKFAAYVALHTLLYE